MHLPLYFRNNKTVHFYYKLVHRKNIVLAATLDITSSICFQWNYCGMCHNQLQDQQQIICTYIGF